MQMFEMGSYRQNGSKWAKNGSKWVEKGSKSIEMGWSVDKVIKVLHLEQFL